MPLEISEYDIVEDGDIKTYEREVKTPMPANEDGSGYATEENVMTVYTDGEVFLKVSKVSNIGWSVWRYIRTDEGIERDTRLDHGMGAQEAMRYAKQQALSE